MDEYLKNEMRLIECYRGSSNKQEAQEYCQVYADRMKNFVNEGGLNTSNSMKDLWKKYYKTKNYYDYK